MDLPTYGTNGDGSERLSSLRTASAHLFEAGLRDGEPEIVSVSLCQPLSISTEMLGSLTDATPAGQRYLMIKIVNLLRDEALRPSVSCTVGEGELVSRCLADLEHALARLAPDIGAFDASARILIEILSFF